MSMECVNPQPPAPPTYGNYIMTEAYPSRCDPKSSAAPCAPDGPPGFLCASDDHYPPQPYVPQTTAPQEACEWEGLPTVQLPPAVPRALCAVPDYYPQRALRNRAPPCEPCDIPQPIQEPQPPCCMWDGAAGGAQHGEQTRERRNDVPQDCGMFPTATAAGDGPTANRQQRGKKRQFVEGELSAGVPPGMGAPWCMPRCPDEEPDFSWCEQVMLDNVKRARRMQFDQLKRPPTPVKFEIPASCFVHPEQPRAAGIITRQTMEPGTSMPGHPPPGLRVDCPPPPCQLPPTPAPAPDMTVTRNPCAPLHPAEMAPDPTVPETAPLVCPPLPRAPPPAQLQEVRDAERREAEVQAEAGTSGPPPPPVCRPTPLPPALAEVPCCPHLMPFQLNSPPEAIANILLPTRCELPTPRGPPCPVSTEFQVSDLPTDLPPGATGGLSGYSGSGGEGLPRLMPVVDKYSLTRYTDCDWRKHNEEVMRHSALVNHNANTIDYSARRLMERCAQRTDGAQDQASAEIKRRAQEILHWRCRLERALVAMAEEVNLLQQQRQRLRMAMGILKLPESIAAECIAVRQQRLDCDLVRDDAEEELIREASLMKECRCVMESYLQRLEGQIECNLNIKTRCEFDWSDKKIVYDIEQTNLSYRNASTNILFRPGSTRIPDNQSNLANWDMNTRENINILEAEVEKSKNTRFQLERMMTDMIRSMRQQADRVQILLEKSVKMTVEAHTRLECDLKQIRQRIVDAETLVKSLRAAVRSHDAAMKKVQTRLCNRLQRPRVENCADPSQTRLLQEVQVVSENVSSQKTMIDRAEHNLRCLIHTRGVLEQEIMHKRQTLFVTRDRIRAIRAHYPSAAAMTGC